MPPKKLKIWADELSNNNSLADDDVKELKIETSIGEYDQFMQVVNKSRHDVAKSLEDFKFDKTRVRILSDHAKESCINGPVLYWMARDGRVEDNWAMIFSQKLAIKFEVPLHVCYCLVPTFLDATIRGFNFLLRGLREVQQDLLTRNIQFHLLYGEPPNVLADFVEKNQIGCVVCDFAPLRLPMQWVDTLKKRLPAHVPLCQVDAHNVIPCWVASDKQEWAARTLRPKIHKKLSKYLTYFPPVIFHPHTCESKAEPIDWEEAENFLECDRSVAPVLWLEPGYRAGMKVLHKFLTTRLPLYFTTRGDPTKKTVSDLSPYFHFGQVSTQRVILEVSKFNKTKYKESAERFIEQALVRRELADNFCFYNQRYDSMEAAPDWARKSLQLHIKDKRDYIYSRDQLEKGKTHDKLWNACQNELVLTGKMHGFMRLYWAKKILEWSENAETALEIAIYFNDRYELDGRDPNGFVGCLWSIGGLHDRAFRERPVIGKVRWMSENSCKSKFKIEKYIKLYA